MLKLWTVYHWVYLPPCWIATRRISLPRIVQEAFTSAKGLLAIGGDTSPLTNKDIGSFVGECNNDACWHRAGESACGFTEAFNMLQSYESCCRHMLQHLSDGCTVFTGSS